MRAAVIAGTFLVASSSAAAFAQQASIPGATTSPYPTLTAISLDWLMTGDDDDDGVVNVRYRRVGDADYRSALPLARVPAGSNQGHSWSNRHAGSIFGLEPGTEYEIELALVDPDGGDTTETFNVTTRAEPTEAAGARVTNVDPASIDAALDAAEPGDVFVLADGEYSEIVIPNDGADGQPIVVRAENAGGAVVNGDVRIDGRSHVIVEGLHVNGKFKFNDAESIVVRGNTIVTTEDGIVSYGTGVRNALIVDNDITGATEWSEAALGVDGDNVGEGIVLTGAGNVIAFNRVRGFRDCISLLEDDLAVEQISIDIYGNDLSVCADDGIEADFSMGNVRVHHNRITDSFMGISSQPSLGGPTYFIRNVMFNVLYSPFKLQRSSVGDVLLHNTVVKTGDAFAVYTTDVWSRATSRNNLFIGGPGDDHNGYDSGPGDVTVLATADASCSFDYDGFGSIGTGTFHGRIGGAVFDGVEQMRSTTTEEHGLEVDLSVFAAAVELPADPYAAPDAPSVVLSDGSAAIDAGLTLANVNDGFDGDAPDLGAVELGASEPTYGPGGDLGGGAGGSGGGNQGGGDEGGNGEGAGASEGGGAEGGGGAGASDGDGGDGSCDCRTAPRPSRGGWLVALGALAALLGRLRGSRRA